MASAKSGKGAEGAANKSTTGATSRKKLNRDKPYGEVYGSSNGAVYEQNGIYFNAAGLEILPEGVVVVEEPGNDEDQTGADLTGGLDESPAENTGNESDPDPAGGSGEDFSLASDLDNAQQGGE